MHKFARSGGRTPEPCAQVRILLGALIVTSANRRLTCGNAETLEDTFGHVMLPEATG